MEALEPKKSNSDHNKGTVAGTFFALSIIYFLALFVKSSLFNLPKCFSDMFCSCLMAQSQLPNEIIPKNVAFLLFNIEKAKEHLVLNNGGNYTEITNLLLAKGFVLIRDIYLDKSGNVVCAAFDTTDIIDNWEIVNILSNGKVTALTNTCDYDESSPSMSNDQKKLAYIAAGSVFIEDSGIKTMIRPRNLRHYIGVRWTPEDRLLVIVEEGRRNYISEIDPAKPYFLSMLSPYNNRGTIRNPVISPNGKNLVYVCERGGNTEIVMADRFGNNSKIISFGDNFSYTDSTTIIFSRELGSRSNLYLTDGAGIAIEYKNPDLLNYPSHSIHSISSYTPYVIPASQEKPSANVSSDNKGAQNLRNNNRKGHRLSKNYPNPFNPSTTIQYAFSSSHNVRLDVFNIRGQFIRTLVDEHKPPGKYSVVFNAGGLSNGVYLYRLVAGDFTQTRKMVLLK